MPTPAPPTNEARHRAGLGLVAVGLGVLALLAPFGAGDVPPRVGALLALAGLLEIGHAFRRAGDAAQRAAWLSGTATLAMGLLLVNAPLLAGTALLVLLAAAFALDGLRRLWAALRGDVPRRERALHLLAAAGNLGVAVLILALRGSAVQWTVAVAGSLRIFGTAWNILTAPVYTAGDAGGTVMRDLGLDDPQLVALADRIAVEEQARASIDRGWILAFVATLFAIHIGRMGFDRSALGILSPGVAVLGDVLIGLVLAFAVVVPIHVALRKLLRPFERRAWQWCLRAPAGARGWARRALRALLTARLRFAVRLRDARYSLRAALARGLQIGLPLAAVLAATFPVWGMSWYFDTENWAAGVWNSWAESRTDTWREAMLRAVAPSFADPSAAPPPFAVAPPGVDGDFAFVVIGDTGEGDASQHVLRDQLLAVAAQPDVRFVVVSSDVVYPTGAMRDYEAKFWLPFKGVHVPVYAIPGNHDWYDALEGFAVTFLAADAARAAIRARAEVDLHLTSTTDAHVADLLAQAAALRAAYGVSTGWQQATFFQLQTPRFALLAVDTGVARRIDPLQRAWLEAALDASRGKFVMAILGHPFYAGGALQGPDGGDFRALHRLLRERGVAVVMAGDTHDFEYYAEPLAERTVHHFVNGGGGAYLSFGTALDWPAMPPAPEWAFYPNTADVVAKIEQLTPRWKQPAWWWTHRFGAWPFSPEFLSAAFDYNQAPFFQSFVEVRVEPSAGRVRFLPYGINGRLRWHELQTSPDLRPPDVAADAPVEWVLPLVNRESLDGREIPHHGGTETRRRARIHWPLSVSPCLRGESLSLPTRRQTMLTDKVAIVTGAGSGLGRAGAVALAEAGARVLVSDLNEAGVHETAELIAAGGGQARALVADAGSAADAERTVRAAVDAFGALHVLYNNAGVAWPGRDGFTPMIDAEVWDTVIRINLSSVFYHAKFAIPEIARAGGGSIINTASSMAHLPLGGLDGYAASKGGVALLTKSLAVGCGTMNIRVNAISPGYVDTPMNALIFGSESFRDGFAKGHATGLQTPEEIADLVVFLASDASRSLTGAVLNCDRGWTAFKQPDVLRG